MENSVRLAVQISEHRSTLNAAIEKRNKVEDGAEVPADIIKEMDETSRALTRLEVEYRAALTAENAAKDEQEKDEPDAEDKEIAELFGKASIVPFIQEVVEDRAADGAEKELREATLGEDASAGTFPVEMLAFSDDRQTETEMRADTVTPVAAEALADGGQAAVLPRVFRRSMAARLGVSMPSVPVGAHVYPIMSGGTAAAMAADDAEVDANAAAFTGHTLEPIRLSAAYLFRVRQTLQLRNFEAVLRRDLNAVMSDAMDDQIINGDGNAPNVAGFLSELPAATDAVDAAAEYQDYVSRAVAPIDGLNAYEPMDLRTVIGSDTFKATIAAYRSDNSELSAWDRLRQLLGGISVSGRIPAQTAAKVQTAVTALTSYPGRNAVAPIWRGVELIRDPYTNAAKGQVRLTAVMYWNFKILREAGWHLWRVKTAA